MLTKDDLKAIEKLLESRINKVEENLESRIEEQSLEIQKEITLLKAEMKREFRRVHADQNLIIKHFNEEFLDLQERVEKIEQKTHISI
ncbi:MAG: hypothetical protein Q7S88_00485 [Candidatus Daviesbacteria bacterium]|nr:hypothetical protein [Candidatus Daviesbacteria bacterium]